MRSVECLIVGGGPAGLAAAHAAARAGVQVMVVDENRQLGGQYYRMLPGQFHRKDPGQSDMDHAEGGRLIESLGALGVEVRVGATAWGIVDRRTIAVTSNDRTERIRGETLVLATGAYDRPVPFPGWTLPGVMSAGAAQNLMKGYGITPGYRVLVAGSGPLLLAVAYNLIQRGVKVEAICEASQLRDKWTMVPRLLPHLEFVRQGYAYWRAVRGAGVPLLHGHIIRRASGVTAVERVIVSRCDENWQPVTGTERSFEVDVVIVGYGFISSTELSHLAGCEHRYREDLGCWILVRNSDLESTVEGVFVVGDAAGVGGSAMALAEGRLAGTIVANRLGRLSGPGHAAEQRRLRARLRSLGHFRRAMDSLYRFESGVYTLADPDTVLCRCEEVAVRDAAAVIQQGAATLNEVKVLTGIGMGRCQGRMCGPGLSNLISRITGRPVEQTGRFSARMPAKPIPLGAIADGT